MLTRSGPRRRKHLGYKVDANINVFHYRTRDVTIETCLATRQRTLIGTITYSTHPVSSFRPLVFFAPPCTDLGIAYGSLRATQSSSTRVESYDAWEMYTTGLTKDSPICANDNVLLSTCTTTLNHCSVHQWTASLFRPQCPGGLCPVPLTFSVYRLEHYMVATGDRDGEIGLTAIRNPLSLCNLPSGQTF